MDLTGSTKIIDISDDAKLTSYCEEKIKNFKQELNQSDINAIKYGIYYTDSDSKVKFMDEDYQKAFFMVNFSFFK